MKNNLKTYPSWDTVKGNEIDLLHACLQWKEDFEKEIQKKIDNLEISKAFVSMKPEHVKSLQARILCYKEILGDI